MSRRKRPPSAEAAAPAPDPSEPRSSEPRWSRRLALDLGILAVVFGATVGIAELAGAANLGVALGIGQVVFAIALVWLLLRD